MKKCGIILHFTHENPGDIKQLLDKHIPIKINGEDFTAEVDDVSPFLMGL